MGAETQEQTLGSYQITTRYYSQVGGSREERSPAQPEARTPKNRVVESAYWMMDLSVAFTTVMALLAAVVGYISIIYLLSPKYDPREPPVLSHFIPYVGHIIGMIRYGTSYFEMLSAKNNHLPIFTLQTLNKRTYIVSSADLVTAVERNQKTISFFPFVSAMSPRVFDLHRHGSTMDIINQNLNKEDGDWGLVHDTTKLMHAAMAPGPNLDRMNRSMLSFMAMYFDELAADGASSIGLYEWIRPRFTIASTEAIYGPGNPFKRQPDLGDAFWDFDRDFTKILLGVAPRYLASKGWKARQKIIKAINVYFAREDHKTGLGVLQCRHEMGIKYGASIDEISRFEIGDVIGVLINATPTLFWTLVHIHADPSLLQAIRTEISAHIKTESPQNGSGPHKHILDITALQSACPLLLSTYREILRTRTQSSTSRWITQDTILASTYLLKKDSVLLIPGAIIHADPVWGPDAKEFNPRRFLSGGKSETMKAGANRTWGGGQTLCPGRFFATMEIVASVAMVLGRFELVPVEGGEEWKIPRADGSSVASSIHPPKTDLKVGVREREGFEGDEWAFKFADE